MNTRMTLLRGITIALAAAVIGGCNSGSSSLLAAGGVANGVIIGLTDAPGAFVSYQVDVKSLTLTKADGATVETAPVTTRVDFAQYADLTEFLTGATVPSGKYTGAAMTLDFTNADIEVEDAGGNIVKVPPANIVDDSGDRITTLQTSVMLSEGGGSFTVVPGLPALMTVDFNLNASNSVDLSGAAPVVTVQPVLVADIDPAAPKPHRLRGALKSVDLQGDGFTLYVRPFFRALAGRDTRFGALSVGVDGNTLFDIDQADYQGAAGLTQLAAEPGFTAVVVLGNVDPATRAFTATQVLAGSSVPGGTLDAIQGTVVQRQGDVLTIKGATLSRSDGTVTFGALATVQLANTTRVRKQLDPAAHNIGDVSVGQRVTVLGTLTDPATLAMDASGGVVRMELTTLRGTVAGSPSPFTAALQSIDGRDADHFDFTGTGVTSGDDADPAAYSIDPNGLDLSAVAVNDPLAVRGFPAPFGQVGAGSADDFTAETIVDLAHATGLLAINWAPPSAAALGVASTGLTLDMTGVGKFHYLDRGGELTDLTGGGAPVIAPPANGAGVFLIVQSGAADKLYLIFADFANDLSSRLNAGATVRRVAARGSFDDATAVMTSGLMRVRLN